MEPRSMKRHSYLLFFVLPVFIIFTQGAGALEFYKNESDDTSSVSAGSALDAVNLTITVQGGDYIIISSFNLNGSATNNRGIVNVSVDGTDISVYDWTANVARVNNETFLAINKTTLSAGTHTILMRLTAVESIDISNARISVLSYGSEDRYNNSEDLTLLPSSFTEKVNLTFIPPTPGNYLFLATAEVNSGVSSKSVSARFKVDNTILASQTVKVNLANDIKAFAAHRVVFLSATSHNATIEARSQNVNNQQGIARSRIIALRLTDFYPFVTNTNTAMSLDDTGTFQEKVNLTFTPGFEANNLIFVTADTAETGPEEQVEAILRIDDVEKSRHVYSPEASTDFVPFGQHKNINLDISSHSLLLLFRHEPSIELSGIGTARIRNAAITSIIPDTYPPNVISNTNNFFVKYGHPLILNATITDLGSGVRNATVDISAINSTINEAMLINQSGFWINTGIIADRVTNGLRNLTIKAYDNASNVNSNINMTVGIDATP